MSTSEDREPLLMEIVEFLLTEQKALLIEQKRKAKTKGEQKQ